ncbi:MAG: hypothetical protein HY767_02805, partial [Candidatus Omnitrophica bacterium]|nr:hypothetical protein [Candidatus Omnitrophota bacterium]
MLEALQGSEFTGSSFFRVIAGPDISDISYTWTQSYTAGLVALGAAIVHTLAAVLNGGYVWSVQETVNRTVAESADFGGWGVDWNSEPWKNQDVTHVRTYKSSIATAVNGKYESESYSLTSRNGLESRTVSRSAPEAPWMRLRQLQKRDQTYEGMFGDWTETHNYLGSGFVAVEGRTEYSRQLAERTLAGKKTGVTYTIDAGIDASFDPDGAGYEL